MLLQALEASPDAEMVAVLNAQRQRLDVISKPAETDTEVNAVKQADSAWRAASNKHEQLVSQVLRLRKQLQTAEGKERLAALELAKTEANKKAATVALAKAQGINRASGGDKDDKGQTSVIGITMHNEFWDKFEEFDCEETDKAKLRGFKEELNTWKKSFEAKDEELKSFLQRVETVQREFTERMDKKRKIEGGEANGNGTKDDSMSGGAASTTRVAEPSEEALQQEADRISAARFKEAEAAMDKSPGKQTTVTKANAGGDEGVGLQEDDKDL